MAYLSALQGEGPEPGPIEPARLRTGIDHIHLEAALAVDLHGSFSKAAMALNMKPGTVNRRVRDLEFQVGVALFERQRRRTVATPLGRRFLRQSRDMLVSFHDMVEGMRRIASGQAGDLVIGYHGPLTRGPLSELLVARGPELAEIRCIPLELAYGRLGDALAARRVDLAIVHGPVGPFEGASEILWEERLFVGLHAAHPLVPRAALHWAELAAETLLHCGFAHATALRALAEDRLRPFGGARGIVHDVSLPTLASMVRGGAGVCLCLESQLPGDDQGLVFREIVGANGAERVPASGCWNPEPNPALARLLSYIRRHHGGGGRVRCA